MGIKLVTKFPDIQKRLDEEVEKQKRLIVSQYAYVGESCIREARIAGSYIDQTGNLRSSIGYVIVMDGKVLKSSGFEKVKDGKQGIRVGETYARSLVAQFPAGIALIVVAGMNYAAAVESRGRNVLTSAALLANEMVPQIMKKLGFKAV